MADEMVLETQQWLNKTYGSVSGFGTVTEDGLTGWGTVYGLIRGLQHELGITGLVNNFGSGTATAFDNLGTGYKTNKNIVYIIQGGFWCKGINPGAFDGVFSSETEQAVTELKTDAGITNVNATIDSKFMAALLNMSAFVLTRKGTAKIREMQQWLNGKYAQDHGYMPCDGVYQRETNTTLIYVFQRIEGETGSAADGLYGSTTAAKCPNLSVGSTGDAVRILQYGLLVNGYTEVSISSTGTDTFTDNTQTWVNQFCNDMNLDPLTTALVGNRVIKGLLTSNGDTSRASMACDTSFQLSTDDAKLIAKDYKIVGRYLTGTVGTGEDVRKKNLTSAEITRITAQGLSIFPIFQSGGAAAGYFTNTRGYADGITAIRTARQLGFAAGTTIYFACDVDILEANIDATIVSYIEGVHSAYSDYPGNSYQIGLYGTRNVCLHAWKTGYLSHLFISDMSTGYSGNLGFPMPMNWSFNQFVEINLSDTLAIDKDAVDISISDAGCSTFETLSTSADELQALLALVKGATQDPLAVELDTEYPIAVGVPGITVTYAITQKWNSDADNSISITNGDFDTSKLVKQISSDVGTTQSASVEAGLSKTGFTELTSKIKNGAFELAMSGSVTGTLSLELDVHVQELQASENFVDDLPIDATINFKVSLSADFWDSGDFSGATENAKKADAIFVSLGSLSATSTQVFADIKDFLSALYKTLGGYIPSIPW